MDNYSKLASDLKLLKAKESNKPVEEKLIQIPIVSPPPKKPAAKAPADNTISPERLREAIIWAEIIGKPRCKRRKIR